MVKNAPMVNVFRQLAAQSDFYKIERQDNRLVFFAHFDAPSEGIQSVIKKIMSAVVREGSDDRYQIDDFDAYTPLVRLPGGRYRGFASYIDDQYYYSVEVFSSSSRTTRGVIAVFSVEEL